MNDVHQFLRFFMSSTNRWAIVRYGRSIQYFVLFGIPNTCFTFGDNRIKFWPKAQTDDVHQYNAKQDGTDAAIGTIAMIIPRKTPVITVENLLVASPRSNTPNSMFIKFVAHHNRGSINDASAWTRFGIQRHPPTVICVYVSIALNEFGSGCMVRIFRIPIEWQIQTGIWNQNRMVVFSGWQLSRSIIFLYCVLNDLLYKTYVSLSPISNFRFAMATSRFSSSFIAGNSFWMILWSFPFIFWPYTANGNIAIRKPTV